MIIANGIYPKERYMTNTKLPTARDLMEESHPRVTPEMSLEKLAEYLVSHRVAAVPVVAENGSHRLLGFVSEGDVLKRLANDVFEEPHAEPATVATIMKRHPLAVTGDLDLFGIASIFISHNYRSLPVVDDAYNLLGIVARHDVMEALRRADTRMIRDYVQEHYPPDLHSVANLRFVSSVL